MPLNLKGLFIFKLTMWSEVIDSGPLCELEDVTQNLEPVFLIREIVVLPPPSPSPPRRRSLVPRNKR